jgi:hypothetical protein
MCLKSIVTALVLGGALTTGVATSSPATADTGPCNMMAMMNSVSASGTLGAMDMQNMAPEAMAQMQALMRSSGCSCTP